MAQHISVPPVEEADSDDRCQHHWVIQPATGPLSKGVCQSCGETRDFKNYVESASWGDARLANRPRSRPKEESVATVADAPDGDQED